MSEVADKLAAALPYIATLRTNGENFADDNAALDAVISHANAALAEYDALERTSNSVRVGDAIVEVLKSGAKTYTLNEILSERHDWPVCVRFLALPLEGVNG